MYNRNRGGEIGSSYNTSPNSSTAGMSSSKQSFSEWMAKQEETEHDLEEQSEGFSLLGRLSSIQDSLAGQLTTLSGTIDANAGPLSAAFQQRVKYALYLIIAAVIFLFFAIAVGLPTIVLRPSKFVMCMTLATSFAAASVVVMQTPQVFLSNMWSAGLERSAPFLGLIATMISTFFITIFYNRYLFILTSASLQVACLLWYLSTYIPGGPTGLKMLVKAAWLLVSTAAQPCMFVCKKTFVGGARLCISRYFS